MRFVIVSTFMLIPRLKYMRYFGLIAIALISFLQVYSSSAKLRFEQISTSHGLSQSEVNAVFQDKNGFIWIGTLNGLNRFDGYDLLVYKKNSLDSTSLSSNYITGIHEDNFSNLWIATTDGLNLYNKNTDRFTRYLFSQSGKNNRIRVNCILERKNGDLIIASTGGAFILKQEDNRKQNIEFTTFHEGNVIHVMEDKHENIWLSNTHGIHVLQTGKNSPLKEKCFFDKKTSINI